MHEGICGRNLGARSLMERVINQGFYWPTLREDAKAYVKSCNKCQVFENVPQLPSIEQMPVVATWPFDMWGMDLMGRFSKARNGYEYLVVAVGYFSKWIEAKLLASSTDENVSNFLRDYILCQFGVMRAVVTDHGVQF